MKHNQIVGWVIFFEEEPDIATFVPRALSMTDLILAMQWERPSSTVCIRPVTKVPDWAEVKRF